MVKWLLILFAGWWVWDTWGWIAFGCVFFAVFTFGLFVLFYDGIEHRKKVRRAGSPTGSLWSHIKAAQKEIEQQEAEKREAKKREAEKQKNNESSNVVAPIQPAKTSAVEPKASKYSDTVAAIAPDKFHMVAAASVTRNEKSDIAASQRKTKRTKKQDAPSNSLLPRVFRFIYTDSSFQSSERTVNVSAISYKDSFNYLEGYCEDRRELRTFRTDRIRGSLTDMDTGEIITVKRLLSDVRERKEANFGFLKTSPVSPPQFSTPARKWEEAVFFAGFRGGKLYELEDLAIDAGWQVRGSITRTVSYVVANGGAGNKQLAEAESLGIPVIDEDDFRALV